jgi:hypothetical protein
VSLVVGLQECGLLMNLLTCRVLIKDLHALLQDVCSTPEKFALVYDRSFAETALKMVAPIVRRRSLEKNPSGSRLPTGNNNGAGASGNGNLSRQVSNEPSAGDSGAMTARAPASVDMFALMEGINQSADSANSVTSVITVTVAPASNSNNGGTEKSSTRARRSSFNGVSGTNGLTSAGKQPASTVSTVAAE